MKSDCGERSRLGHTTPSRSIEGQRHIFSPSLLARLSESSGFTKQAIFERDISTARDRPDPRPSSASNQRPG